jgi:release factor glutamine methyltransferase
VTQEPWTALRILQTTVDYFAGHGVEEARLDAELLLAEALGVERIKLYTDFGRALTDDEVARYRAFVKERAAGRPARYIIGRSEFYSIELKVDERVLIPRPETEILVERALEILNARSGDEFALVADLCTGSGAVAIAIARNFEEANLIATDVSPQAVELARENAATARVRDRIEFLIGDLFEPLVMMGLEGRVDLIVTNPPYVSDADWPRLPREIRKFEPRKALVAGPRGTEVQERIIADAADFLKPGAALLLEMDPSQRDALASALVPSGRYEEPVFHKDYARRLRVLEARRAS